MEEEKIVLFIFCEDDAPKEALVRRLSKKVPTLVITTEYIPSDFDTEETITTVNSLSEPDRTNKINSSIQRAFTNTEVSTKKQLFIIDRENIPLDRLAQYSFSAKFSNCRLITMHVMKTTYHNDKHFIFLQSKEFALFAKLFKRSNDSVTIIDASDKNQRHIDVVKALHENSEITVIDSAATSPSDISMYSELGIAHNYSLLSIETGGIEIKNPTITLDGGKPFPLSKKRSLEPPVVTEKKVITDEPTPLQLPIPKTQPFSMKDLTSKEWWKTTPLGKLF